jgi:hypothetical protein
VLTFLQLITGAATGVFLVMPLLLMTVIPFRPDRTAPHRTAPHRRAEPSP